jgi:hypothetical protein
MEKVNLVLGIKNTGGTTQIDVLERAEDDPSYGRAELIEPHAKEGKHDYYTVVEAWALEDQVAEPKGD